MKFVFASYAKTAQITNPDEWLNRIGLYSGILSALAKHNHVTSIEQINYEGESIKDGVNYKFVRLCKWGLKFPLKLHQSIKKLKPDVVVIHGLHYPLQVMQLRIALGTRVKIIVQHHAEHPFTGLKKYLQCLADPFVDAYLFASHDMGLDWVKRGNLLSPKKIHEVMEVSSVFYLANKNITKTNSDGNFFLWVGRLNAQKDPITVVTAFLKYAVINPRARLYMIYQIEELLPQIKALLNNHPRSSSIILVGKVPNEELVSWYNKADFFLSGSNYEGSGTAVCEAMSFGCVPVVTNIFSFRMMTNNGNCGYLYEPGDVEALVLIFIKTLQTDIQQKRKTTLSYFKSHLSFEAIADRIDGIANTI